MRKHLPKVTTNEFIFEKNYKNTAYKLFSVISCLLNS